MNRRAFFAGLAALPLMRHLPKVRLPRPAPIPPAGYADDIIASLLKPNPIYEDLVFRSAPVDTGFTYLGVPTRIVNQLTDTETRIV